jgi:hypothetical protein
MGIPIWRNSAGDPMPPLFQALCDQDLMGSGDDEPSVGWIGYLSPGRAALLPDSMTAARKEVRGGGVLLDIAASGDVDDVVQANVRLKAAGALKPLPRPMNRAAL